MNPHSCELLWTPGSTLFLIYFKLFSQYKLNPFHGLLEDVQQPFLLGSWGWKVIVTPCGC